MPSTKVKDFPISFLLASLFLICMISFAVAIAEDYGYDESLMKSDKFDYTELEEQVNKTSADAEKWSEAFRSDNLFVVAGGIVLYSIWAVLKSIYTSVSLIFTLLFGGASDVLGIPPLVIGVVTAILIITFILAMWRTIKAGE